MQAAYIVYDNCSGIYQILANGSAQFPGSSGVHIDPSLTRARIAASFVIKDYQTDAWIPDLAGRFNRMVVTIDSRGRANWSRLRRWTGSVL